MLPEPNEGEERRVGSNRVLPALSFYESVREKSWLDIDSFLSSSGISFTQSDSVLFADLSRCGVADRSDSLGHEMPAWREKG